MKQRLILILYIGVIPLLWVGGVSFISNSSYGLGHSQLATQASQDLGSDTSPWLDSLLRSDARLAPVIKHAAKYEVQIIYTQINRDENNEPHFTQHNFRLDARQYFNPASLVKLPVAVLALEKLNSLKSIGVTRNSPMATGIAHQCQTAVPYVVTNEPDYQNSVGNYIKRMLLVSDNNAYNRLYEFLGQRPINERLNTLGYTQARIVRRFAPCDTSDNRYTNPITFYDDNGQAIYTQPAAHNPTPFTFPLGRITKGKAYRVAGKLVHRPYDFTTANYLPLQYVTDMLKAVIFPNTAVQARRINISPDDSRFLRHYLHNTPHSSNFKPYRSKTYFDTYKKYLYYGRIPQSAVKPGLKSYNVVGMSHGYLADVAYFADSIQNTEFMLSCVLYVNQDEVINDGVYEYKAIGLPFLRYLGKVIYGYEIKRPKRYQLSLQE